jgi:hypothetical protein
MTREQAVHLAGTKWWERVSPEEAALFQLYEEKLCMPFGEFQAAMEKLLGRGVWTHEFAYVDQLKAEAEGRAKRPTFEEIVALIPEEKRIIVDIGETGGR